MEQPEVRYCMTGDGVRLAYHVIGEGAPKGATAFVRSSGFPSHLTAMWGIPGLEDVRAVACRRWLWAEEILRFAQIDWR